MSEKAQGAGGLRRPGRPDRRRCCRTVSTFIVSPTFDYIMGILIVLNAVLLGIQVDIKARQVARAAADRDAATPRVSHSAMWRGITRVGTQQSEDTCCVLLCGYMWCAQRGAVRLYATCRARPPAATFSVPANSTRPRMWSRRCEKRSASGARVRAPPPRPSSHDHPLTHFFRPSPVKICMSGFAPSTAPLWLCLRTCSVGFRCVHIGGIGGVGAWRLRDALPRNVGFMTPVIDGAAAPRHAAAERTLGGWFGNCAGDSRSTSARTKLGGSSLPQAAAASAPPLRSAARR